MRSYSRVGMPCSTLRGCSASRVIYEGGSGSGPKMQGGGTVSRPREPVLSIGMGTGGQGAAHSQCAVAECSRHLHQQPSPQIAVLSQVVYCPLTRVISA